MNPLYDHPNSQSAGGAHPLEVIHGRHVRERAEKHAAHDTERRDMHNRHRTEKKKQRDRHDAEIAALIAKHTQKRG